jgi:hypothetical protein
MGRADYYDGRFLNIKSLSSLTTTKVLRIRRCPALGAGAGLVFRECGRARAETDAIMKNVNDQNCSFFNPPFSQPVMSHSCRPVPLYLFVALLLISFTTRARPNAPFRQAGVKQTYADSLKGLLRQHNPDTSQVNQLLVLSDYYLSRHREIGDKEYLEEAYRYYRQAAGLSNSLALYPGRSGASTC